MNAKALLLAIAGAIVAIFYALESFLFFQSRGFEGPLVVKLGICGAGVYFFWRNVRRVRTPPAVVPPTDAS